MSRSCRRSSVELTDKFNNSYRWCAISENGFVALRTRARLAIHLATVGQLQMGPGGELRQRCWKVGMATTPGLDRVDRPSGPRGDLRNADGIADQVIAVAARGLRAPGVRLQPGRRRGDLEAFTVEVGVVRKCRVDAVRSHDRKADLVDEGYSAIRPRFDSAVTCVTSSIQIVRMIGKISRVSRRAAAAPNRRSATATASTCT